MAQSRNTFTKNIIVNWRFLLSAIAFICFFVTSASKIPGAAAAVIPFLLLSGLLENLESFWKKNMSRKAALVTLLEMAVFACGFYAVMVNSGKMRALAGMLGIPTPMLVILVVGVICAAAFYFLSITVLFLFQLCRGMPCAAGADSGQPGGRKQLAVLAVAAVVLISICSKSSPLYPFNDWVDANCFLTVGKSMLYGKVPYRDLYEQKGPVLYMLHAVAALISEKSFLGVYFFEIIACFGFLLYSFRIMRFFCPSVSVAWTLLLGALVYSADSFCHGDSAEELCLPLLTFAMYVGLKMLSNTQAPSLAQSVAIGVTSACVLWIKYSMLGFYFGWIWVPAVILLRAGKLKQLFQMLGAIAVGVLLVSVPVLAYFAANHALGDLLTVYFYNNLFVYSMLTEGVPDTSILQNLLTGMGELQRWSLPTLILIGAGAAFLAGRADKRILRLFMVSLACTYFFIYFSGQRDYVYYSLIFAVFTPVGMGAAAQGFSLLVRDGLHLEPVPRQRSAFRKILCGLSALLAFCLSGNTYLLSYSKEEMPQYQFAEIIQQVDNATLLNYGFLDGGFYTTTGIVPTCRYFCKLNIPLEEMMEAQDEVVNSGGVDFVVTRDKELKSEQYRCVATATFYFEGANREYYLYQRISAETD